MDIHKTSVIINISTGILTGKDILCSRKLIRDLVGVFGNEQVRAELPADDLVYEVQAYLPVDEGKEGGLFFGNSTVYPGKVDKEYYMTRGHFHRDLNAAEFYWCIKGEGVLILMDVERKVCAEKMQPGSLHYIPGGMAHRVANTGAHKLVFNACWSSDAGHNYQDIDHHGFSARLEEVAGKPVLMP